MSIALSAEPCLKIHETAEISDPRTGQRLLMTLAQRALNGVMKIARERPSLSARWVYFGARHGLAEIHIDFYERIE